MKDCHPHQLNQGDINGLPRIVPSFPKVVSSPSRYRSPSQSFSIGCVARSDSWPMTTPLPAPTFDAAPIRSLGSLNSGVGISKSDLTFFEGNKLLTSSGRRARHGVMFFGMLIGQF